MKAIDLRRSALLVIDMQRYFLEPGADAFLPLGPRIVPRVMKLIESFRHAKRPVVFTRHAHNRQRPAGQMSRWWRGKLPWEGDPQSEIIAELKPARGERVVTKTRYSVFEGTGLAAFLRRRRVSTVVLCGVMTNLCVETSARHAFVLDFQPVIVEDACATKNMKQHRASILNLSYGFAPIVRTNDVASSIAR